MRYFLPLLMIFAGCSGKPLDRTKSQERYSEREAVNQEKSLRRSEVMAKIHAYDSQISSIDGQVKNQKQLIRKWEKLPGVASSEAMIANARLRLETLAREREELVRQQEEWKEKLGD